MQRATTTDEIIRIASTQKGHILERQATPTALARAVADDILFDGYSYGGDRVYQSTGPIFNDMDLEDAWAIWLSIIPDIPVHERIHLQYYRGLCTLALYDLGVLGTFSNDFYIHSSLKDYVDQRFTDCDIIFFDSIDTSHLTSRRGIPTLTAEQALTELCVPWMEPQWYDVALADAVDSHLITEKKATELQKLLLDS